MDTTDKSRAGAQQRTASAAFALIGLACLAESTAIAAEFDPQVTIGITRTDNIFLDADNEVSEKVYRAEPSFIFFHDTSRIFVNANYLMEVFRYHDLEETEVFHQYDASIRAALIPQHFFLQVGGNRSQDIVDPEQSIPLDNLAISSNRQDRDSYYAAPSFQYAFGRSVLAQGEYVHSWIEYGDSDLDANQDGEANFSIDNYQIGSGLTWALRYNWQRTEYEEVVPWEYQQASAELGFWVGISTRLFAAGGRESAWDMPLDPSLQDDFWEGGFSQQIGERLSAEFAVGERSFGSSWRGNLALQFQGGSTAISYVETPTTSGRLRLPSGTTLGPGMPGADPDEDPIEIPEIPDDFLSEPGVPERYISKRLEWTLGLEFRRSGLAFALFDADHTERAELDGTLLPDQSHRGGSVTGFYRVGARTDFELGASWIEREFGDGDTSELLRGLLAANYRLGNRTTLTLAYDYAEEDGESLSAPREYVVNTVSLLLTYGTVPGQPIRRFSSGY